MIKVTVELKSAISKHRDKVLGVAYICNDNTGTVSRGNYGGSFSNEKRKVAKHVSIKDFPRKSQNHWELLRRCLNELHSSQQRKKKDIKKIREVTKGKVSNWVSLSINKNKVKVGEIWRTKKHLIMRSEYERVEVKDITDDNRLVIRYIDVRDPYNRKGPHYDITFIDYKEFFKNFKLDCSSTTEQSLKR